MTESDYTRKVVKALKQRLPTAVTFKLADMFTMGVPDFTVTRNGVTSWFEAKLLDETKHWDFSSPVAMGMTSARPDVIRLQPTRDIPGAQWETLRRLVRGYLVLYTPHGHAVTRVSGLRETVGPMRLKMITLEQLVKNIIAAAENGHEEYW